MKDSDKNRCPEKARKRAASDARCALGKLGFREAITSWAARNADAALGDDPRGLGDGEFAALHDEAQEILSELASALGLGGDR